MELKEKLKKLRMKSGMTQEMLAEHLHVSSQTVSKWERGLLAPDIMLLPKIAVLFRCSIDSIFDMESSWDIERKKAFSEKIKALEGNKDYDGLYRAYLGEIELNPDQYENYARVARLVVIGKLFDEEHFERLLLLVAHAEKYCSDSDIKHEIYRNMIVISANMKTEKGKIYAEWFYRKLPKLRDSREIYAQYVLEGEALQMQTKRNIMRLTSLLHSEMQNLLTEEISLSEKIFYHEKNKALIETITDCLYGGYFDEVLLWHEAEMARLYMEAGQEKEVCICIENAIHILERHEKKEIVSPFYCEELPHRASNMAANTEYFLRLIAKKEVFFVYRDQMEKKLLSVYHRQK